MKLFPSLALAMLGQDQAAAGRIWLLLRYLDQDGRGWLDVGMVRDELTGKESELRVCGWRQLRNLLGQGGGVFWQRDRDRLWLYSAARVSAALGIDRLSGRPVALPVKSLLGGIGRVRAHFYASFHSGREDESTGARPISRATLRQITHVPQRTQRLYERTAGIRVRSNIAVGQRLTEQTIQERAWRQGRAVFAFNDRRGQQGTAGGRYVAWRLPNSYQGCHAQSPPGRQKKINRQIDLVNLGAQGNELPGEIQKDHTGFQGDKPKLPVVINPLRSDEKNYRESAVFHSNGQSAGKAYNRNSAADAYWPQLRDRAYRPRLWHIIARAPTKNDTFSKTRHFSRGVS